MAAEYQTEEERKRAREKANAEKVSANDRIAQMVKAKTDQDLKLRQARKDKSDAEKAAKTATLAANAKSATYPVVPAHFVVAPGTPIVASAAAFVDGRLGSKEDVVSWITASVGFIGAVASVLTDNPTGALFFATAMGGGLASTGSRRLRAVGEKMRADSKVAKAA